MPIDRNGNITNVLWEIIRKNYYSKRRYYFVYGCFKFQYFNIDQLFIFNTLINNLEIFNFDFYLQDVDV